MERPPVKAVQKSALQISRQEPPEPSQGLKSRRAAIAIQVRRLISHFPSNKSQTDWDAWTVDCVKELERFELEDIASVVSSHIRTAEFFPKLSELYMPLAKKADWKRRAAELSAPVQRIPHYRSSQSVRDENVARWKEVKRKRMRDEQPTQAELEADLDEIFKPRLSHSERNEMAKRVEELMKISRGSEGA